MEFINALINETKDLEERNDIRENFLKMGLLDLLYQLRSLQSKGLEQQLDIFSQQLEEDKSALMYVLDLASARIPSSSFIPVYNNNDMWVTDVYIEEVEQSKSDDTRQPLKIEMEFDLKKSCSEAITAIIQRLALGTQNTSKEKEWQEEWGLCWVDSGNLSQTVWLEPTESLESYRLNSKQQV